MPVSAAYLLVVIIWSTTPLGIVWSSESIDPSLALLLRMSIAIAIGLPLMALMKVKMVWTPAAMRVYVYSSLSLAIGMLFCYLAARYISSGLMSLSFGIAPILSGLLAQKFMGEAKFTNLKKVSLALALVGLALVSMENMQAGNSNLLGMAYISVGVIMFSLSGVLVKTVPIQLNPLTTTMGSLLLSLPLFVIFWVLAGAEFNYVAWQPKAIASVVYLGIFASLIGFLAYFYILQKLSPTTVALVVMITPVISTTLGILVNDELFNIELVIGGTLVITGLAMFQFGHKVTRKKKMMI